MTGTNPVDAHASRAATNCLIQGEIVMNTKPKAGRRLSSAASRLLGTMLGVWVLGAAYIPAVAATSPTVTVDQQPLTLQPPIPPNVTLMLDDSGSMVWDYMPDACYLYGVTCVADPYYPSGGTNPANGQSVDDVTGVNNDAMIDAANNGVYYNPSVTYSPPPTASGGTYANYTDITNVPADGFQTSITPINLTKYSNQDIQGEVQAGYNKATLYYSISKTQSVTAGTPYGPVTVTYTSVTTGHGSNKVTTYTYADQICSNLFTAHNGIAGTLQFSGLTTVASGWATGTCTFQISSTISNQTFYYFQYSTGPAAGPTYTDYYVAPASQGCGTQNNCYLDTDTSGLAAPYGVAAGQNIANWFAYYHTRIQMAKSGLMTAFSTVSKSFRIGFGSIDGGCNGDANNLPSAASTATPYTYTDSYNCGRGYGSATNKIASVQPFGDGSSSTDQKNGFWNWVAALKPSGGTPLREALDAVGQYYETSQPWSTMSSDPSSASSTTEIACRQAYTIMTTDGFWNETYSPSSSSILQASDNTGSTVSGPNGQSYTYTPAAPYSGGDAVDASGNATSSLADVAMYYWETDLRGGTANEVPTSVEDPAFWQHMTTFTMGLGFTPYGIQPSGTTIPQIFNWTDGTGSAITGFTWPSSPSPDSLYNIADLAHAAVNGHGGFYSATSPQAFASGIAGALQRAAERVGTGASLAANSTQLTNGTVAYQANYYTAKWKGDLKALSINSSTGAISTVPTWSAANQLNGAATTSAGVSTYPNRNIVTYVPPASSSGTGSFVAFQNSSSAPPALSSAELLALDPNNSAATQMQIVNYLRGDNTLEEKNNGSYRNRDTPLGDIVDSQPVYSGAPDPNEFENQSFTGIGNTLTSGDNSFEAWAMGTVNSGGTTVTNAVSTRESLVFVAANDGMLHAFDATTGNEVYAYLPGAVITAGGTTNPGANLASLANPTYGSTSLPHQYYDDGELTIADAYLPGLPTINGYAWHTILIGTTGRGPAEAVYALDITNPSNITPLWERSAGDGKTNSTYIGQMVGKPVIAKVQDGTNSDWQVLIGNGYNSASGTAALLEFDLATGTLSVHTATSRSSTSANGLAAPVTWMDDPSNGISTEAYAGDLQGQVWRFPLGYTKGSNYVTDPSLGGVSTTGTVVFSTPLDSSGNPQPITAGMTAGRDPVTANVWVFFGTGQYLSNSDLSNKQVESWYGVIASPGGTSITSNATQSSLVQRSIIYELDGNPSANPPTLGMRAVTPMPTPSDMTGKLGWYMNLEAPTGTNGASVAQGERMVTPNQFQGNLLLSTTRIPVVTDICNPSGSGWVMAVDPFTGTNPSAAFFLNGGGTVTFTYNGKTVTVPTAGVGFSALPNNPIFVGGDMLMSFDNGSTSSLMTSGSTGNTSRVSWQELVNP